MTRRTAMFEHFYRPGPRTDDRLAACLDCGDRPTAPAFGPRHEAAMPVDSRPSRETCDEFRRADPGRPACNHSHYGEPALITKTSSRGEAHRFGRGAYRAT